MVATLATPAGITSLVFHWDGTVAERSILPQRVQPYQCTILKNRARICPVVVDRSSESHESWRTLHQLAVGTLRCFAFRPLLVWSCVRVMQTRLKPHAGISGKRASVLFEIYITVSNETYSAISHSFCCRAIVGCAVRIER
jgi:hypothetical protein